MRLESGPVSGRSATVIAALWGFAEATVFFIVPDVFLTAVAVRDWRSALRCCGYAAAAALVGGVLMYWWGAVSPVSALALVETVPAISPAMMERARHSLMDDGATAIMLGLLSGTPFKVYAAQASEVGLSLGKFILIAVPARLARFVLTTMLAAAISRALVGTVPVRMLYLAWLLAWAGFYSFYFARMPG
ncbi:MAG TPA: hypothetical protein VIT67_15630 [Povalibacter sp.]|jgi:membrane protein YqaA with SNARE-associated domain